MATTPRRRNGRGGEAPQTIALHPVLDLAAAAPLAEALRAARGRPVLLDASAVQRLGGQCLQVLLSAAATWATDGAAFAISAPSENFAADLGLLGLPVDALNAQGLRA